jgi:hypothetical protein
VSARAARLYECRSPLLDPFLNVIGPLAGPEFDDSDLGKPMIQKWS